MRRKHFIPKQQSYGRGYDLQGFKALRKFRLNLRFNRIASFSAGIFAGVLGTILVYNKVTQKHVDVKVPDIKRKKIYGKLTPTEKYKIKNLCVRPNIVVLYDKQDGVACTNKAIAVLERKGVNIIKVPSSVGMGHPIFIEGDIDGVFLPGGPDVPVHDDTNPRKVFESQLIQYSKQNNIPGLAICRGHQTIGHHSGDFHLTDLKVGRDNHPDKKDDGCPHYADHAELCYEHQPHLRADGYHDYENIISISSDNEFSDYLRIAHPELFNSEIIEYPVKCMHMQHIVPLSDEALKYVVGKSKSSDGSVEISLWQNPGGTYIIGLQHHPEIVLHEIRDLYLKARKELEAAHRETCDELQEDLSLSVMCASDQMDVINAWLQLSRAENGFKEEDKRIKKGTKPAHYKARAAAKSTFGFFLNQVKRKKLEKVDVSEMHSPDDGAYILKYNGLSDFH